jgi:flagellar biosynthesis protein FlhG
MRPTSMLASRASFDQAAGLRRLLAPKRRAVLPVASGAPGVGKTAFVVNFAVALERRGLSVLIFDQTNGDIAAALGIKARYELRHVLAGDRNIQDVALQASPATWIVPARGGLEIVTEHGRGDAEMAAMLAGVTRGVDVIMINAALEGAHVACDFSAHLHGAAELLLVSTPHAEAITATYSRIKRLARQCGQNRFRLLVNQICSERAARRLHRNVTDAAKDMAVQVEYGGFVPDDPLLRRAGRMKETIFARAPRAEAARAFERLATSFPDWDTPEFGRMFASTLAH